MSVVDKEKAAPDLGKEKEDKKKEDKEKEEDKEKKEDSLVMLEKDGPTVSDKEKEAARYEEKREAALTKVRAKSDRSRKLAPSQQSPYAANSTAKVIIPNKKTYPGYNPFAPIDKKKLKELADWLKTDPHYYTAQDKKPGKAPTKWYGTLRTTVSWLEDWHMDAWINVLRKRYHYHPQMFRSERMCFLDHLFSQQWRFNYPEFKKSEPDPRGLGRRLPGGAWYYFAGSIPTFCKSDKSWGEDVDDIYAPVNYKDTHWFAIWISIPKRHIVVWDSIISCIRDEELDEIMEPFINMVPYLLVECTNADGRYTLDPFTYKREPVPQARSGDCGVYALKYIECHALGMPFNQKDFAKTNAKNMRDKMAVDIFKELPGQHEKDNQDNDAFMDLYM